ncbi:MAG TPA: DUF2695 domain-containing protein, partial [Planctomycetota bacterium]|nr:DUF2695 domain-containing protein [Planctomycetota bacterium]
MPYLKTAKVGLSAFVHEHPGDADALRLLSQAEEALQQYGAARRHLERAMALSSERKRSDLKKLMLLKEYEKQWDAIKLSASELEDLEHYLDERLGRLGCDHTLRITSMWL